MKLTEVRVLSESVDSIKAKLTNLTSELSNLTSRGGSLGHGSVLPQYKAQFDRLKATQKTLRAELKLVRKRDAENAGSVVKDIKKDLAIRDTMPKAQAERLSKAQSEGNIAANAFVKKHGGYDGVANYLEPIIKQMTNDGTEPFDPEAIANKVGITKGSVNRWLRRPEFRQLKKYT